jgi:hypothetical protein
LVSFIVHIVRNANVVLAQMCELNCFVVVVVAAVVTYGTGV